MERFDIAVFGAGPAGICAAIQAARGGARTLLVEKNGCVGGAISSAGVAVPGLFDAWGRQVISGVGWELVRKTLEANGDPLPDFSRRMTGDFWRGQVPVNSFLFVAIAEEELVRAGVTVRYHTMPGAAEFRDGAWKLTLCGKDGLYPLEAKILIDCTGDANLTRIAGYDVIEPAVCQPGTGSVRLSGCDPEKIDRDELAAAYAEASAKGEISYTDLGWFKEPAVRGVFLFLDCEGANGNHICGINAADSQGKTRIELESHASVLRAFRFLKGRKGLEHLTVTLSAPECGVRETRTIRGEYTMTADDYTTGRQFPDALCYTFYFIDLHDAERGLITRDLSEGVLPQVPRGILVPAGSRNFLAAGRIVSSDREANSALRIQATCMATGQAAAANALAALETGTEVREVPAARIRELLAASGAIVPSV